MSQLYNHSKYHLSEKIVVIINGKGGVGKDTFCDVICHLYYGQSVSAITPVLKLAEAVGWNGQKDNKSRRFLSNLKRVLIEYNDLPNRYLEEEYRQFLHSSLDVLFVHIRESDQIDDFKRRVSVKLITLLITSTRIGGGSLYGNASDDEAENYNYDYEFHNEGSLSSLNERVHAFWRNVLSKERIRELPNI